MNPLLTIVRLKPVERELHRIADALEAYMSVVHHYNMTPPKPLTVSDLEESISYSEDEKTTLLEAKAVLEKFKKADEDD